MVSNIGGMDRKKMGVALPGVAGIGDLQRLRDGLKPTARARVAGMSLDGTCRGPF